MADLHSDTTVIMPDRQTPFVPPEIVDTIISLLRPDHDHGLYRRTAMSLGPYAGASCMSKILPKCHPNSHLAQCALVSSTWHDISLPYLFETIAVTFITLDWDDRSPEHASLDYYPKHLESFLEFLSTSGNIAERIQDLAFVMEEKGPYVVSSDEDEDEDEDEAESEDEGSDDNDEQDCLDLTLLLKILSRLPRLMSLHLHDVYVKWTIERGDLPPGLEPVRPLSTLILEYSHFVFQEPDRATMGEANLSTLLSIVSSIDTLIIRDHSPRRLQPDNFIFNTCEFPTYFRVKNLTLYRLSAPLDDLLDFFQPYLATDNCSLRALTLGDVTGQESSDLFEHGSTLEELTFYTTRMQNPRDISLASFTSLKVLRFIVVWRRDLHHSDERTIGDIASMDWITNAVKSLSPEARLRVFEITLRIVDGDYKKIIEMMAILRGVDETLMRMLGGDPGDNGNAQTKGKFRLALDCYDTPPPEDILATVRMLGDVLLRQTQSRHIFEVSVQLKRSNHSNRLYSYLDYVDDI